VRIDRRPIPPTSIYKNMQTGDQKTARFTLKKRVFGLSRLQFWQADRPVGGIEPIANGNLIVTPRRQARKGMRAKSGHHGKVTGPYEATSSCRQVCKTARRRRSISPRPPKAGCRPDFPISQNFTLSVKSCFLLANDYVNVPIDNHITL